MSCHNSIPSMSVFNTFNLGAGFWANVPTDRTADLLQHHLLRAWQAIADYRLPAPTTNDRLELVVMLAVEAELLFFNAATFNPCQEDRDPFFADFIRRSLQPVPAYLQ